MTVITALSREHEQKVQSVNVDTLEILSHRLILLERKDVKNVTIMAYLIS